MSNLATPIHGSRRLYIERANPSCGPATMELDTIVTRYKAVGWEIARSIEKADAILIISCHLDVKTVEKTRRIIKRLMCTRRRLILGGCITAVDIESAFDIADDVGAEISIDTHPFNIDPPHTFLEPNQCYPSEEFKTGKSEWQLIAKLYAKISQKSSFPALWAYLLSGYIYSDNVALLSVGRGCLGNCSYCGELRLRSRLFSVSLDRIMENLRLAKSSGKRDIVLVGDDLSAYGRDQERSFSFLLGEILENLGENRLLLDNCNPLWLLLEQERVLEILKDPRIVYLTFSLQSIHDHLLRNMRRNYTADAALTFLEALRRVNHSLVLVTHIIVGFPGESCEDFSKLLRWTRNAPCDIVEPFSFKAHPGTVAASLPNAIPEAVKSQRRKLIYDVYWKRFFEEARQGSELIGVRCVLKGSIHE